MTAVFNHTGIETVAVDMGPLRSENGGRAIRTVDAFLPWSIGEARRATLKGLILEAAVDRFEVYASLGFLDGCALHWESPFG